MRPSSFLAEGHCAASEIARQPNHTLGPVTAGGSDTASGGRRSPCRRSSRLSPLTLPVTSRVRATYEWPVSRFRPTMQPLTGACTVRIRRHHLSLLPQPATAPRRTPDALDPPAPPCRTDDLMAVMRLPARRQRPSSKARRSGRAASWPVQSAVPCCRCIRLAAEGCCAGACRCWSPGSGRRAGDWNAVWQGSMVKRCRRSPRP